MDEITLIIALVVLTLAACHELRRMTQGLRARQRNLLCAFAPI